MCGLYDGVLGFEKDSVIKKTVYGQPSRFETPNDGKGIFCGVVIDVDENTGLARDIFSIYYVEE